MSPPTQAPFDRLAAPQPDPRAELRPAPRAGPATRLSGREPAASTVWRAVRAAARLARTSLVVALLTMPAASCLVTSAPQFEPPAQTAPFLVKSTADPDPRTILVWDDPLKDRQAFSAQLVSEDAGEDVQVVLFVDYGKPNEASGWPYQYSETHNDAVSASTLDDPEPRIAKATLFNLTAGCHTVTMMVSHAFDSGLGCPLKLSDSDQITWTIVRCDGGSACAIDPQLDCPAIGNPGSCPEQVGATSGGGG